MASPLRRMVGEDIELVVEPAPDLWNVHVDRSLLEQAIMNLVINARQAMPTGGGLTIQTANLDVKSQHVGADGAVEPGDYVNASVTDTGVGMDERTLGQGL